MKKQYSIILGVVVLALLLVLILSGNKGGTPQVANTPSGETSQTPGGETTTPPQTTGGGTQSSGTSYVPVGGGRIVFAITDATVNFDTIKSIMLTVSKIQAHSAKQGWITTLSTSKTFDLLELKNTASLGLLADVPVSTDSYQQIKLSVSEVKIVFNDGSTKTARLPSGELKFVNSVVAVDKNKSTEVTFDFDASRSLVMTGNGEYIFAPVVKFSTRPNVISEKLANNKIRLSSGSASTNYMVGMDENGTMKDNFALDKLAGYELVGDVIKVRPQNVTEEGVQITPAQAIATAKTSAGLQSVLSIKLILQDTVKIWRVIGVKNGTLVTVNVHAVTGAVLP